MKFTLELDTDEDLTPVCQLLQGLCPSGVKVPMQEQVLNALGVSEPLTTAKLRGYFPTLGAQSLAAYLAHLTRRGLVLRTPRGYLRVSGSSGQLSE